MMGPAPDWAVRAADGESDEEAAGRAALDAVRPARIEAALQAGWLFRYDPLRDEFTAAREMHTGRSVDKLLDAIERA